jgi:hypothetical protein
VSKGQVSVWVRDVVLTDKAKVILKNKKTNYHNIAKNPKKCSETWRKKRRKYQQEGRKKAKENDPIHRGACMLYWAEGTKDRTAISFTNSDVNMILVFKKFLEDYFDISDENFKIYLNFHDDIHSKTEVMNYWSKILDISISFFAKPYVNHRSKVSKQKRGKIEWGTCCLRLKGVKSVKIIQHIYGAIKEYAGIEDKELWLD